MKTTHQGTRAASEITLQTLYRLHTSTLVPALHDFVIAEKCNAGLLTGCRAGVHARTCLAAITKSHRLSTRETLTPDHYCPVNSGVSFCKLLRCAQLQTF